MRLGDVSGWRCFVYQLVYPAILGSMLYDVFNFSRVDELYAAKALVVLIYCVDYLHLFRDLQSPAQSTLEISIDAASAIMFRCVFSAVHASSILLGLLLLLAVAVMFTVYNFHRKTNTARFYPVAIALLAVASLVAWIRPMWSMTTFLMVTSILGVTYSVLVFRLYRAEGVQQPPNPPMQPTGSAGG